MSSYYSSSILSSYLRDTDSACRDAPAPAPPAGVPEILVSPDDATTEFRSSAAAVGNPPGSRLPATDARLHSRPLSSHSGHSSHSAVSSMSLYSSVSESSDDMDLQSVRVSLQEIDTAPQHRKRGVLKSLWGRKEPPKAAASDEEKFFSHVQATLKSQYYSYEKSTTLQVAWADAAEVFFFGATLDTLFAHDHLLSYLTSSSFELGEVRFSNLQKFHRVEPRSVLELLRALQPELDQFNGVLDLYAESKKNMQRPELFEIFSRYANHSDGLCLPLATAMFGHWLLAYSRDSSIANNYENPLILNYFRKGARLALVLRKVAPVFGAAAHDFEKNTYLDVCKYWGKDNTLALGMCLHGLGEYYQYTHQHDLAVALWEMSCHLTEDAESGNLAIMGLANGYGYGNRVKERNRLGKRSKTNKFNTKRRIAQLYRVLMKDPKFDEYGVSWATKEKYD